MPKQKPSGQVKLKINILYPQGKPKQLASVFVSWLLQYGRFFLIAVEFLVITMFVFRFSLDENLADLKDKIEKENLPFIMAQQNDEALIRQTQAKLDKIQNNLDTTKRWAQLLNKLSGLTPTGIHFTNVSLEPDASALKFRLSGKSTTSSDLNNFDVALKNDSSLTNVILSNVGVSDGLLTFTFTGAYK